MMTEQQLKRAWQSAGVWFVGSYMEMFLMKKSELDESRVREELIEVIYNHPDYKADKNPSGTRIRVNALYSIIKGGCVEDALEKVISSKQVGQANPESVKAARQVLEKIKQGEISC